MRWGTVSRLSILFICSLGLAGCPPPAYYAGGQLSLGNKWAAWEMIAEELENPTDDSPATLCENHVVALMILSEIVNYDFAPSDADRIAEQSYRYIVEHCSKLKGKMVISENRYGRFFLESQRPGFAIPHFKNILALSGGDTFGHMMAEGGLADCYAKMGKFDLRDYHRVRSLAIGKQLIAQPVRELREDAPVILYGYSDVVSSTVLNAARPEVLRYSVMLSYLSLLKKRLDEVSWSDHQNKSKEMMKIWGKMEAHCRTFVSQDTFRSELSKSTLYAQYLFAADCFSTAGETAQARRLLAEAEDQIQRIHPKNKALALLEAESTLAGILEAERKREQAAALRRHWIEELSKPTGKSPSANDYRLAGLAQEAAGRYDLAIEYLTRATDAYETMRASFPVRARDQVLSGQVGETYWGLVRSYAARYRQKGREQDFDRALQAARMLRARQFGELIGIDAGLEEKIPVSGLLQPNEVLVDVVMTNHAAVLFALSHHRQNLVVLPTETFPVVPLIRKVRDELSRPGNLNTLFHDLQRLSRILLDPILEDIPPASKIVIIPDGLLNGIPLAVLSRSADRYRPLLWDHEIVLSPSISYFLFQKRYRDKKNPDRLFALADPQYGSPEVPEVHRDDTANYFLRAVSELELFSPLPETRIEVENIARLYPPGHVHTVFGENATESYVKGNPLDSYRYLHFATHGILGSQIPGVHEPALVLAAEPPGSGEDGYLTLEEVENLNLHCDLTVLSACDTGSGKYYTGEGVMGLSRGFLLAGSRSVIVSLWPVSSEATVQLMSRFYENLRSGMAKSESLRRAQLDLMGYTGSHNGPERGIRVLDGPEEESANLRWKHPFFWAPFVLIGE